MNSASLIKTVLVADSDHHAADLLVSSLEAGDVCVRAVAVYDGMQAVLVARAAPFDVVLLTIEMTALDGIAAATAIRQLRPRAKLLVVAVSNSSESATSALDSNAFDMVLSKPVDVAAFINVLFPERRRDAPGLT